MPPGRPFPAVTGGCFCGAVRYRLLTIPLFCYACHCADCHKRTGSVFACYTTIEAEFLISIGSTAPKFTNQTGPTLLVQRSASCPKCGTSLWSSGDWDPVTVDVRTGTLDHPELMEPDLHSCIESKIPWVHLPEGAKTCVGKFNFRKEWPKISVKRFDAALARHGGKIEEKVLAVRAVPVAAGERQAVKDKDVGEEEKEADKTPTAQSPEEKEDDEAFEKRFRETEKALQERLHKLNLKLSGEEENETKASDIHAAT